MQVTGLKKATKLFRDFPKELPIETMKEAVTFMKNVKKTMHMRVPRTRIGALAEGIGRVEKGKNWVRIIIQSPYLYYQEFGFKRHRVYSIMPTKSGMTIGELYGIEGSFIVKKFTPFVFPSLKINIAKLSPNLSRSTKKAINKARK